jgi:capsule polysaccharide export protein KpsE/RkpR
VTGVTPAVTEPITPVSSGDGSSLTLSEASAEEKRWKAKSAELAYKEAAGELEPRETVEAWKVDVMAKIGEAIIRSKTKLLGLPGQAKAAIPHLTTADIVALDRLVREALEDLAAP